MAPLTPQQFRAKLVERIAETFDEDEREAARLRALLPGAVRLIVETLGPRRVTLYGSLATGLFFAAHSDVDLAVEDLGIGPPENLAESLKALLGRKVDLVDPALVAPHVRRSIDRQGIALNES